MEGCLLGQGPGRRSPTEGRGLSGACLGRRRRPRQALARLRERGGGEEGTTQAVSQAGGDAVQTWVEGGQTAGLRSLMTRMCVSACERVGVGGPSGEREGAPPACGGIPFKAPGRKSLWYLSALAPKEDVVNYLGVNCRSERGGGGGGGDVAKAPLLSSL